MQGFQSKIKNRMANSEDPDEMAHNEPSHQDLHCLQRYLIWSVMLKGLCIKKISKEMMVQLGSK